MASKVFLEMSKGGKLEKIEELLSIRKGELFFFYEG